MIEDLSSYLALITSSCTAGYLVASITQLSRLREALADKVREFEEVGRLASQANHSLAAKLQDLDDKIDSLQQWRSIISAQATQNNKHGWQK